jgi:DNA-binding NarL/FixJ family response regulator
VRRGLRVLLGSDPDLEVCGEVSNDREVLSLASMKKPDLIIMGLARIEGLKAIASIRDACPEARIGQSTVDSICP